MVVNVVTHFASCANIGSVTPEGLSIHRHFSPMEECVGEVEDVVLHGVERNLTCLTTNISMTNVEDLPIRM